jgi:hypothetical protein
VGDFVTGWVESASRPDSREVALHVRKVGIHPDGAVDFAIEATIVLGFHQEEAPSKLVKVNPLTVVKVH